MLFELNNCPFAAQSLTGFPDIGEFADVSNFDFKFEFMSVKEDPVSKRADNLKLLIFTVEIGLAGGDTVKQFDNTAQKLMTAAGKRFELSPFFLRSFP